LNLSVRRYSYFLAANSLAVSAAGKSPFSPAVERSIVM
jgi:hypothetical protein